MNQQEIITLLDEHLKLRMGIQETARENMKSNPMNLNHLKDFLRQDGAVSMLQSLISEISGEA